MFTVLIAGGGRVGAALASLLREDERIVAVVDRERARIEALRALLPDATRVLGDPTDPAVLEQAGVQRADAVVAVTDRDPDNLVVASLAKFEYGVSRTIARIVDPAVSWLYTPEMGVDVALNQAQLMAHLVAEEISLGEMTTLVRLRRGQFALVEERADPGSGAVGRTVSSLGLPERCVLVAVVRGDDVIPAHGDLRLEAGDEVLAVVHAGAAADLQAVLAPATVDDNPGRRPTS